MGIVKSLNVRLEILQMRIVTDWNGSPATAQGERDEFKEIGEHKVK